MAQRSQTWVEQANLRDTVRSQEQLEPGSHVSLSLPLARCIHLPHWTVFLIVRKHSCQCSLFQSGPKPMGKSDWPPFLPKPKHPGEARSTAKALTNQSAMAMWSCWNMTALPGTTCYPPIPSTHMNLQLQDILKRSSYSSIVTPTLVCVCVRPFASVVSDSVTLWTLALQAPLPMGFCRQEYWSGLPCPPSRPRDRTRVSCIAGGFSAHWAIWEAHSHSYPHIVLITTSQWRSNWQI